MKREVNLDSWVKEIKKRTSKIPVEKRPKRIFRSVNSRTPEESDALAYAVMLAWENALESGELKKEADGSYTVNVLPKNDGKKINKQVVI